MIIIPTEKRLDWQRAPIVLCFLVILNILVFAFYQSGDDAKYQESLGNYLAMDLLDIEWPIYQRYLQETNQTLTLDEYNEYYDDEDYFTVAYFILLDRDFNTYLDNEKKLGLSNKNSPTPLSSAFNYKSCYSVLAHKVQA